MNKTDNRIERLFAAKKSPVLSVYFTAGHPGIDDTVPVIRALAGAGVDMIEVGMPFSDPMADGAVIQHSSAVALQNGMSISRLFTQLKDIRKVLQTPLLLMGYLNPVLRFGMHRFCRRCRQCGIDGVIIPDLPMEVCLREYRKLFRDSGVTNIFLVTPQTPEERLHAIDRASEAFIYMVAHNGTTGERHGISDPQQRYFQRMNKMELKHPLMAGFGISDKAAFDTACRYVDGAIVGSAFVRSLEKGTPVAAFIRGLRAGSEA